MKKILIIPIDCGEKYCENCIHNTKNVYNCDLWDAELMFYGAFMYRTNRCEKCLQAEVPESNLLNVLNNENKKYIKIEIDTSKNYCSNIDTSNNFCSNSCKFLFRFNNCITSKCIAFNCKLYPNAFSTKFKRCNDCLNYEKEYYS